MDSLEQKLESRDKLGAWAAPSVVWQDSRDAEAGPDLFDDSGGNGTGFSS